MSGPTLYRLPVARGNTAAGIYLGAVGAVAVIVFLSIWAVTQLTAYLSFAKISANSVDRAANARVTRQGNARRRWTVESEEGNRILGHTDLRLHPSTPPRKEVKVRGSALTEGRARA
jgi:hypothetical protein